MRHLTLILTLLWVICVHAQENEGPVFNTQIVESVSVDNMPWGSQSAATAVLDCLGNELVTSARWSYMLVDDRAQLCELATQRLHDVLPQGYDWPATPSVEGNPFPPTTPDRRYVILEGGVDNGWQYWSYEPETEMLISLGRIDYEMMAMSFSPLPRSPFWLNFTMMAFSYGASPESISKRLFLLDAAVADSLQQVASGWFYRTYNYPPRIEKMTSVEWLRWKTGYGYPDDEAPPCKYIILDAAGYREYVLGDTCQVEYATNVESTNEFHSDDGQNLIYLRDVDLENGIAQIMHQVIDQPDGEQTLWFEGEIEYLLSNTKGTAVALMGDDGTLLPDWGTAQWYNPYEFNASAIVMVRGPGQVETFPLRRDTYFTTEVPERVFSTPSYTAVPLQSLERQTNTVLLANWNVGTVHSVDVSDITSGNLISVSPRGDIFIFSDGILYNVDSQQAQQLVTSGSLEEFQLEWVEDYTFTIARYGQPPSAWRLRQ